MLWELAYHLECGMSLHLSFVLSGIMIRFASINVGSK